MSSISTAVSDYQTPERMAAKHKAIELPDVRGLYVLDIGCDFGAWTFKVADEGAAYVLGLDRGRDVRGHGFVDIVEVNTLQAARAGYRNTAFQEVNLGKQWPCLCRFDLILMFSVYHHVFENCGDHHAVWYWLAHHTMPGGTVLWENPVDDSDRVVQMNVSDANRKNYTKENILAAASEYFDADYVGPAIHEPTREVWRFTRKTDNPKTHYAGVAVDGAGGATKAFLHADGRRISEIAHITGQEMHPGSLNIRIDKPFEWSRGYYRAMVSDVEVRGKGLDVPWRPRWTCFYLVTVSGLPGFVFRFEGEAYPDDFIEVISSLRLRDYLGSNEVIVCQ